MGSVSQSPPRVIGRYALYDAIASGGMATVHLGRLLGHVGFERTVAIKRLHPQFSQDPDFVSMFLDEARLVGRIRHPNVVPTLDVVAVEGELFIVMEYVQGESLARLVKAAAAQGSRIPPPFVATMLSGVLHGLHAAHEARNEHGEALDIVHRDISPQNIMVGTDGIARVLDFGVAKAAGRMTTTREGQLKGKLAYMAPEQMSGIVSRATDVYAASVVLWEALTGRRLFVGDNEGHVMKLVLENRVTPPSDHVPDVPAALDALTLRGLSRDPAERFSTAREMALALEDAISAVAPSKIGAWVEATASKPLFDRHERIAAIESNSSLQAPAATTTPEPPPPPPIIPPSTRALDDVVHTQLSSGSASSARPAARAMPRPRRPRFFLVAGGAAAVAVSLFVAFSMRRVPARVSTPATSTDVAVAAVPPPASAEPAAPEQAPAAVAPTPDAIASTMPSVVAVAAASSGVRAAPRRGGPPAQQPSAARARGVDDGTGDRK